MALAEVDVFPAEVAHRSSKLSEEEVFPFLAAEGIDADAILLLEGALCGCRGATEGDMFVVARGGRVVEAAVLVDPASSRKSKTSTFPACKLAGGAVVVAFFAGGAAVGVGAAWKLDRKEFRKR